MKELLLALTAALLVCACQPPPTDMRTVAVADSAHRVNQPFAGDVRSAPVAGTEVYFNLDSSATVFVIATITFSIGAGTGYTHSNLEADGQDGGEYGIGHHFATVGSDSGDSGPSTSATCFRVESRRDAPGPTC